MIFKETSLLLRSNIFFSSRHVLEFYSKFFWSLFFPAFRLNTERYAVSLRIQSKCGKISTRKTPIRTLFTRWTFDVWSRTRLFILVANWQFDQGVLYKTENWHALSHEQSLLKQHFLDICRCAFKLLLVLLIGLEEKIYLQSFLSEFLNYYSS